jgi:hypothetical protein
MDTIARITAACEQLDDDQLDHIVQLATSMLGPSVYSTLSEAERREIDEAIARLDRGESIDGPEAMARLRARIADAKARATDSK